MTAAAATRWASIARLLAAPALLLLGALYLCPAGDCRPHAFDTAGMAIATLGHTPLADAFFQAVTWAGSILVLGPLALAHAAVVWRRAGIQYAMFLPVAMAGAVLIGHAAKLAIARARPDVASLIDMPIDYSFPSAHSLQISTFVLAWLLAPGRARPLPGIGEIAVGALLVLLVAWSRLHLQVHYPSDILFAIVAGVAWVLGLRQLSTWSNRACSQ